MSEDFPHRLLRMPDGTTVKYAVGSVWINWQTGERTWLPPEDGLGWIGEPKPRPRSEGQ